MGSEWKFLGAVLLAACAGQPGEKGERGELGAQGEKGERGESGPAALVNSKVSSDGGTVAAEFQFDAKNCGAENHDCLGGACSLGVCQPSTIIGGEVKPQNVAVNSTRIFWDGRTPNGGGYVASCEFASCANTRVTLATANILDGAGIALDGANAYFTDGTKIKSCALGGCSNMPTTLFTDSMGTVGFVSRILTDGTNLFWIGNSGVYRCATSGCTTATKLWTRVSTRGEIAIDDTNVYVYGYEGLVKCAKSGCNSTPTVLTAPDPYYFTNGATATLSIGSGQAFWINGANADALSCSLTGCAAPTYLARNVPSAWAVLDGANYYWGGVRCAVGGCDNIPKQTGPIGATGIVASNATALYFAQAGLIQRVVK